MPRIVRTSASDAAVERTLIVISINTLLCWLVFYPVIIIGEPGWDDTWNDMETYKSSINVLHGLHFSHFPNTYVISRTLYINSSGFPKNRCEYTMDNGTVVYDKIHISTQMFTSNYYLWNLENVYVSMYYGLVTPDATLYYMDNITMRHLKNKKHQVLDSFKKMVWVTQESSFYGDIFLGHLVRLICIPLDAYENAVVSTNSNLSKRLALEILKTIGAQKFTLKKLVSDNKYLYHAENLWTILPIFNESSMKTIKMVRAFNGPITNMFGDFMREKCRAVEPYRMVFYNRKIGSTRRFEDKKYNELINLTIKEYPMYTFCTYIGDEKTIAATVKSYSSFKWMFAMTGSNIMNVVFMKPRCSICVFLCNEFDGSAICSCVARDLITIAFTNEKIAHYTKKPIDIDIDKTFPFIKRSLAAYKAGQL